MLISLFQLIFHIFNYICFQLLLKWNFEMKHWNAELMKFLKSETLKYQTYWNVSVKSETEIGFEMN